MSNSEAKTSKDLLDEWNAAAVDLLNANPLTAKKKGLVLLESQKQLNEFYNNMIAQLVKSIEALAGVNSEQSSNSLH